MYVIFDSDETFLFSSNYIWFLVYYTPPKTSFLQLKKSFLNFHILSSVNKSLVCGQNARVKPL